MTKLFLTFIAAIALLGAIVFAWQKQEPIVQQLPQPSALNTGNGVKVTNANQASAVVGGAVSTQIKNPASGTNDAENREFDPAINPYAGALKEPGKSKRPWDADYINHFATAQSGDPVEFELTHGVMAKGNVEIIQRKNGTVNYISGVLIAPEAGKFFFLTPTVGGKAGKAVGIIEFPASKTAYRIEPTGANGDPELWQRRLDEVMCAMEPMDTNRVAARFSAATNDVENITPLQPAQMPDEYPSYNTTVSNKVIISLQSNPGADAVLLLDFFGGYTPSWGGVAYAPPPVDNNTIKGIWAVVAEDFMPFNINVTTDKRVYEEAPAASRQRCCYTTTPVTAAGVAYEGSWNWGNDIPCWSVYYDVNGGAAVGSHEPGHTLGLSHDGRELPGGSHEEYFAGQGSGATGWCPIMGASYYQPVTTWCKGEYQYANNTEDQLNIIVTANNNVAYRSDDTGGTKATSRYLEAYSNSTVSAEGLIEHTGDTDAFQFTTTGGAVSLTGNPVSSYPNLAIMATLADASDNIIASYNPQNSMSATIATNLPAGTYTFRITGAGRNNPLTDGFSDYDSMGYYSITGSVAGARMPTRLSVASLASNGTVVGTVPPASGGAVGYSIISGNTGGAFAINNSGVLTVANSAQINYSQLQTNAQYFIGFELFVNITNSNPSLTELNRRVVVTVLPTPPMLIGFTNNVMEHLPSGLVVGTMIVSNLNQFSAPTFSIIGGNTGNMFAISNNGQIFTVGDLNASLKPTYNLIVFLNDHAQPAPLSATAQVTLNVVGNTIFSWTGGGSDNYWGSSANWNSPLASVGPQVVFTTALRQDNTNDVVASLSSARFNHGGFSVSGNSVVLALGITNFGNNTWNLPTTIGVNQFWSSLGGALTVNSAITNLALLNLSGSGSYAFNGAIIGPGSLSMSGTGSATLSTAEDYHTGATIVNSGTLIMNAGNQERSGIYRSAGLTINSGGTVLVNQDNSLAGYSVPLGGTALPVIINAGGVLTGQNTSSHIPGLLTLAGGTLSMNGAQNQTDYGSWDLDGGVAVRGGANTSVINCLNVIPSQTGGTFFDVAGGAGSGIDLLVSGTLINGSSFADTGIIKTGAGVMLLAASNTFTGHTLISNGTLTVNGTLANTAVTVSGGALKGAGTLNGPVTVLSAGTIAAGTNAIGTMVINNNLTLGGVASMRIAKNVATLSNDLITGISTLSCGGKLIVSNVGPTALAAGDTFTLFSAGIFTGSFNSMVLPVLGSGLIWNTANVNVNGSISVISAGSGSPPTTPAGVTVFPLGTNQIGVAWSASAGAAAYILNRDGADIATVVGTQFEDGGLALNSSHCYTVMAVGISGSSVPSASVCGMTAPFGVNLAWDANTATTGGQDGNGTWSLSGTNWWNGSQNLKWYDNNSALFGSGSTTNCSVTISGLVSPSGMTFNQNNGGNYSLNGTGINLVGTMAVTVSGNASATLNAPFSGAGVLTKAGSGTLTLNVANTNVGGTAVNAGLLVAAAPNGGYGAIGTGNLIVNSNGVVQASGDNSLVGYPGRPAVTMTINSGGMITNTGTSSCHLNALVLNGGVLAANTANPTWGNWNLDYGVSTLGSGSTSMIAGGNVALTQTDGTVFNILSNDTVVVSSILDHTGGSGDTGIIKTGGGNLSLTARNTYQGATIVNEGAVQLSGNGGDSGTLQNSAITVYGPGELQVNIQDGLGYDYTPSRTLSLIGGTLRQISQSSETLGRPITMNYGIITANVGAGATAASVLGDCYNLFNSTAVITTAPDSINYISLPASKHFALRGGSFSNAVNSTLFVNAVLNNWAGQSYGLFKSGPGAMILNSNNTFTAGTTIDGGTLEVDGSIASGGTCAVNANATLIGTGTIYSPVSVSSGGTLKAGTLSSIGTLTIGNTLTLNSGSTNVMRINKTGVTLISDRLQGMTQVSYAGALKVSASGDTLAAGDTFSLFSANSYGGGFTSYILPALGGGLNWDTSPLIINGSIRVTNLSFTVPTNLAATVTGNQISLSWPADHTGWRLVVQTNHLSSGISSNTNDWMTAQGSTLINHTNIEINPTLPATFYRLVYP